MTTTKISPSTKARVAYPSFVYRAFKELSYAEDFALRGRLRIANLRKYVTAEDTSRRDETEGRGHFWRFGTVTEADFDPLSDDVTVRRRPGWVETHLELLPPQFVLSCSLPSVDLDFLRRQFGDWVVRIEKPLVFAQELSDYLQALPRKFSAVEGCSVQYSKGKKLRRMTHAELSRLSYSQKPDRFREEREFRFVALATGKPLERFDGDYVFVDLGRSLDYVTIVCPEKANDPRA